MAVPDVSYPSAREAVQQAFVALLFQQRYRAIRVGDIIALAGIGRSTFYNHFTGKDAVLLAAIERILVTLAEAATGRSHAAELTAVLAHVWDQRATGRLIFTPELLPRLQRKLAALIEERMTTPDPMAATGLAAGQLAMLQLWVTGGTPSSPEALGKIMIRHAVSE